MVYKNKYNKYGYKQQQAQINKKDIATAYQKKVAYNMFYSSVKWLEKYVEVTHADHYPDWENRKQFPNDGIKRKDITTPERVTERLSNALYMLADDYPLEFREEWKKEFYEWIDATGIDASDCPEKLKHFLYGFHEILEGREEKIKEAADNRKEIMDVNSPEYGEALNRAFANMQVPLQNQREEEKSLKGKTHEDMKIEKKVNNGDEESGEKVFTKIAKQIVHKHNEFEYFPQVYQEENQKTSSNQGRTLTDKIKQNMNEWNLKEVVVFKGYFAGRGEKKELALVHKAANLKSYNWQGYLEVDPRVVYFKNEHLPEEWTQIEKFYSNKVGVLDQIGSNNPQQLTNSQIIQGVKDNPQNWRVDKISTEIDSFDRAKKQEIMLIRQDARLNDFDPQTGKLNFNNNPIYKWNSFKVQQKFEIKNTLSENRIYLNKDYLTDDEISFVIKEFADKPSVWRTEMIEGQEYLIHNSAQIKKNEIGTLLHEKGKFSNQDWAEVKEIEELNKQHGIVLRKLRNEIPLEFQETHETLEIWAKELEKKLLINGIRSNANEWEVRKEIVVLDSNEGEVLARKTAKISEEDYDLTGELINRPNELYKRDYFDDKEQAEINSILNNYKITEKINQSVDDWMIATVNNDYEVVLNKKTALSNGGRSLNANGEYYKKEKFSDREWEAVKSSFDSSQNQQKSVSELILSESQGDNKDIGRGKIFGILGIIVALIIGSVIVVKKRLLRKVKK